MFKIQCSKDGIGRDSTVKRISGISTYPISFQKDSGSKHFSRLSIMCTDYNCRSRDVCYLNL